MQSNQISNADPALSFKNAFASCAYAEHNVHDFQGAGRRDGRKSLIAKFLSSLNLDHLSRLAFSLDPLPRPARLFGMFALRLRLSSPLQFDFWLRLLIAVRVVLGNGLALLLLLFLLLLGLLALGLLLGGLAVVLALLLLVAVVRDVDVGRGDGRRVGHLGLGGELRALLEVTLLDGSGLNGTALSLGVGSSGKRLVEVLVLLLPGSGGGLVGATVLVKLARLLHLLLGGGGRAQAPAAGVEVALHDATLDLGNNTVVARRHLDGGHLSNTDGNGLTLGGDEDNLLVDVNARLVAKKTGKHELGTVADGVDSAVLDDNTLVAGQKGLQRRDDSAESGLVALVVVDPLGVEDVVKSGHAVLLVHGTGANTAELLHVTADTEEETKVNTEGTDVGTSLARDVEDGELALVVELEKLARVDGTDAELPLDGGDKRRTLEERTSEGLKCAGELGLSTRELAVQTEDCNIFLSGALLALHEAGRAVDANNQTSSDLGVESTGVTSALNAEHALEPGDDFVRGRVGGLVEVDDTGRNVGGQVAAERVATSGNRGEVTGADQDCAYSLVMRFMIM